MICASRLIVQFIVYYRITISPALSFTRLDKGMMTLYGKLFDIASIKQRLGVDLPLRQAQRLGLASSVQTT